MQKEKIKAEDLFGSFFLRFVCCDYPQCVSEELYAYHHETCVHCKSDCKKCPAKSRRLIMKGDLPRNSKLTPSKLKNKKYFFL